MDTTVFFASNRITTGPLTDVASYGPNIQPPSETTGLIYGVAFVGGIDVPSNTQGTITSINSAQLGSFPADAAGDLGAPGRNLLLFLHGFDNTFEDAITRAAFNREWMAASGNASADTTVMSFSWPSLGRIVDFPILQGDYLHDQNMARLSGVHVMSFFAAVEPILRAARANRSRTFLLAHSMGNLALQSAVENWFLHGNGNAQLFDLAILAAGDCPFDAFSQPNLAGLSGLGQLAQRISIYHSSADQVLQLSELVNLGAQRLGQAGPKNGNDAAAFPPNVYVMKDESDVRDYDVGFLSSHQYYRSSPTVRGQIAADMSA
jgi:esterase/lipase superfamily enzyme